MELNNYQKQVMCDLSAYLDCVNRGTNLFSAWREYWFSNEKVKDKLQKIQKNF